MTFHIVTIFPEAFHSYINTSIFKRALNKKLTSVLFYNPRDFTKNKHRNVDGKPYGGGPGMVMMAEPILKAALAARGRKKSVKTLILSPRGKQFTGSHARRLAKNYQHVILIAGHYEGIDARVKKTLKAEEISVGPYVLTGGELPAMLIMDATSRHIKGVLGNTDSLEHRRVVSGEVYTRPETIAHKGRRYRVPKILLSGNHKDIELWRTARDTRDHLE